MVDLTSVAAVAACGAALWIAQQLLGPSLANARVRADESPRNLKVSAAAAGCWLQRQSYVTLPHSLTPQVVITGGSRGLGLELVRRFLELGDDVLVASRTAPASLQQLRDAFPARTLEAVTCDVSCAADVERVAAHATATFSRVDVWINNAALSAVSKAPLRDTAAADYAAIVHVNLLGALHGSAAAMRVMAQQTPPGEVKGWP